MTTASAPAALTNGLAIDLRGVAKTYRGKVQALRGIDLSVGRGEVFGLLGPNGAGKSTLVKILMTVIRPTRCEGAMLGQAVGHKPTLARVGYLPEHHRFPKYLSGYQILDFYGALAGCPRDERRQRAAQLIDLVGMSGTAKRRVTTYSKGQMQRIGLAHALINDPDIVFLDEPTDGVDPVGRREIRDVLKRLKSEGKTIFLNSHLLSEVEQVCDRVAILVDGEVTAEGTIDSLTADSLRYEIVVDGDAPPWARGSSDLHAEKLNGRTLLTLTGGTPDNAQPIIDRLRAEARTIVSARPVRETLEDLFVRTVNERGSASSGVARPPATTQPAPPHAESGGHA